MDEMSSALSRPAEMEQRQIFSKCESGSLEQEAKRRAAKSIAFMV